MDATPGFTVSATLILSARGFDSSSLGALRDDAEEVWFEGDKVSPRSSKTHDESGVQFRLLKFSTDYEWLEQMEPLLASLCSRLISQKEAWSGVVPFLSLYVQTDGDSFPPLFFSSALLQCVASIGAEMDVDVIRAL